MSVLPPVGTETVALAIDGGGTKTDVVALSREGTVLARARGTGSCPQVIGVLPAVAIVDDLVRRVLAELGDPVVECAGVFLSGLDLAVEITTFSAAIAGLGWVTASRRPVIVDNDTFALMRTGTAEPEAVAVVCGTGINCVGRRKDGKTARFPALGRISGDWGGGSELGEQSIWHAARAVDGRGPGTILTDLVPEALGRPDLMTVIEDLHFGRLHHDVLSTLAPVLFAAARAGDPVAASVVDRQGAEIVALVVAALTRLELLGTSVPIVLGGGVLAARDPRLLAGIENGLALSAPAARLVHVAAPPVLGASLLVLDNLEAPPSAHRAAVAALTPPPEARWC
ncbi:N-acetylglucosamine kinase [Pengzhenrongella phosphoraccumulans]|jgi:N-acetylglucosamine kinase-like BadF-type ATPase|uniref:N-acetylglucosamine kinase n=1 Tax=Pengzhenrongella phosphoraccumulans TaxID=3114394 RepID=UPI0038905FB5